MCVAGKNLDAGFIGYLFWNSEKFGQKAQRKMEKWHSVEAARNTVVQSAVEIMHREMVKIVQKRRPLVFRAANRMFSCCFVARLDTM